MKIPHARRLLLAAALLLAPAAAAPAEFRQPAPETHPDLFVWTDTCNAYLLRDGDAALLVDLGDGSVLDHLADIGVERVEWLLLTDHHREGLQGAPRLPRGATKIAAPRAEREFLEEPVRFRRWHPHNADPFTVHGASYVRPPREALPVDRWLDPGETFSWRGREILCLGTPGHSPGGMTYLLRQDGKATAFLGGLMHDGGRMTNWFDTEWDYGFAKGIDAITASVVALIDHEPQLALSRQGPPIHDATAQLKAYRGKLERFRAAYVRGYPVESLSKRGPHPATKPTAVPTVVQVTPHLYMFGPEMAGKNFALIISDAGHGLLLDCGIFPRATLDTLVAGMREHLGLRTIDACWISHMHGDHFTLALALKEMGVKLWTMESIVDKCEHPRRYDYPALIASYADGFDGTTIDRVLHDGEVIEWEGYRLHVDWMPGQTEFANCLWLEIDGKRIAFTGDNLFGNPADPAQDGHECVVARNSAIIDEGYLVGADYLRKLAPDIIVGAHSVLMTEPAAFVERYREWAGRMIRLYSDMLPDPDYAYLYDPYWVRGYPYRVDLSAADAATLEVTVRNFRGAPQRHRVELVLPPGIEATPAVLQGVVAPRSRETFAVRLTVADRGRVPAGVVMVPFDITLDGRRHGQLFDFLLSARPAAP